MEYSFNYGDVTQMSQGVMLISAAISIFTIVVLWKIFQKAGKEGWRAIIPLYNTYTLCEITWGNGWYMFAVLLLMIPIIGWIAFFVFAILTMNKLAKAFGKSSGFTVGLIFLNMIFMAILAFDSSTYLGTGKSTASQTPTNLNNMPDPTQPIQNNINQQPTQPIVNQEQQMINNQVQPQMSQTVPVQPVQSFEQTQPVQPQVQSQVINDQTVVNQAPNQTVNSDTNINNQNNMF